MKNLFFLFVLAFSFATCQQHQPTKIETAKASLVVQKEKIPTQGYLPPGYPLELPIKTNYPYNVDMKTPDQVEQALSKSGGVLIEGVYPNGMKAYYGFGR